jgi:hypothetical protein
MTDYDKIFWGFIFSTTGIALGWTLNQIGQWLKTRQEDKRNLKMVLFNLLETYFIFIRSDFDKYIQKVTDKVHSKFPEDQRTEESKLFIQTLYSGVISSCIKPELKIEIKAIQESYQNSIKTLASIDPLSAYYLSGRKNIMETFDTIQNFFDNLKDQFPSDQNDIELGANLVLSNMKPDILQDSLSDLEKDIKRIAWKINPYVWIKSKRVINRLRANSNERINNDIDTIFEKMDTILLKLQSER